jgi:hypothetical protein
VFQSLRIASRSRTLTLIATLVASLPFAAVAATSTSRGDIVVITVHGTVDATMAGMTVPLSAGAILELPATVRTGADGAVELRQGPSTFAAAGNTELEIPQSAAEDGLVERIVQIRGNAFYSIGKRTGTRLRVEAPYLVAVIKGTQFNVAAQEDSTTIALFEGHLEVRASDESDVVELDPGEIAIRRRNDVSISVLRLNAARSEPRRNQDLAARPQSDSPNSPSDTVAARNDDSISPPRIGTTVTTDDIAPRDGVSLAPERGQLADALPDVGADVSAKTIDLPAGNVDVSVGADASVGEVASVSAGVSTGVDLSAGTVAASGSVGVGAGSLSADVSAGANVNVPAGTVDAGVDTSVAGADVGANVGVDAGAGKVGADVNVGPVNAGLEVGSGGVDVNLGVGANDDSGLLGGLLGRKHRN